MKSNKAITLIALIITIIILLILAGVTINMVMGDNGLINKSRSAVNAYKSAENDETNMLNDIERYISILMVPKELERVTFEYNSAVADMVNITINYPIYAEKKQYKIGENGEWRNYTKNIVMAENNTIYAKYTATDERESIIYNQVISNTNNNILKYSNMGSYIYAADDNAKIQRVKAFFDKSYENQISYGSVSNYEMYFHSWCSEPIIYFQDNKIEPIHPTKVSIISRPCTAGFEPIKDFHITASNTGDFTDEVEIYRGTHTLDNQIRTNVMKSEHTITNTDMYQFYRLYVDSWYPFNNGDGQHIQGCYIE